MTRTRGIVGSLLLLTVVVLAVAALNGVLRDGPTRQAPSLSAASSADLTGFAQADQSRAFTFPDDHGPHLPYRSEWWYVTGNLSTDDGRSFGYQLTLFRQALQPPDKQADRASEWATDQVYMGHFALSDVNDGRFYDAERFARGAAGIAGAQTSPVEIWLEDWQIGWRDDGSIAVEAHQPQFGIDLMLNPEKPIVFQGDDGLSRKGPEAGNASYYYSYTRLSAQGRVRVDDQGYDVTGASWLDREFSSSFLGEDQIGWDWFALQFDNDTELMLYRLRRSDGAKSPYSSGTFVPRNAQTRALSVNDFQLTPTAEWTSPRSGAAYPVAWRIDVPSLDATLTVEPKLRDQELSGSFLYWEGAVRVSGTMDGDPVRGAGYAELTGYADSLQGRF